MRFEFSAGGVVFKKEKEQTLILVGLPANRDHWVFPKGLIGDKIDGEKKEETALREVEEETGIKAKIIESLAPITFWYVHADQKIKKTVYYFLMEFQGGDIKNHDWEMQDVKWVPLEKMDETLFFKTDKSVWQEARKLIK